MEIRLQNALWQSGPQRNNETVLHCLVVVDPSGTNSSRSNTVSDFVVVGQRGKEKETQSEQERKKITLKWGEITPVQRVTLPDFGAAQTSSRGEVSQIREQTIRHS